MDLSPIVELEREVEGSTYPYSPPMVTPVVQPSVILDVNTLFQQMEISRKEDKTHNEKVLQTYIQQIQQQQQQQREQERKLRKLGATHLQRFLSFMVEMIPKSTLIGKLKLTKFSMKIM